jgi:hypothetical protein
MNATTKPGSSEEPEVSADESVPLDGKDHVGEKMMEGLGEDMKKPAKPEDADQEA